MQISLGLSLTSMMRGYGGEPPIITGTAPFLAAMTAGDTLGSAYTSGSYSSTAGSINEPVPVEMSQDDGVWVAFDPDTVAVEGVIWQLRENVTDSAGNTRTFTSNLVLVEQVVIRLDPPAFTSGPTITGTPADGGVMTVAYEFIGTEPITEERRWKINEGILSGETGFTWTGLGLGPGDEVTCEVRLTGPEENTGWIASNVLTVVEPPIILPTNDTLPVISGTPTEFETLNASTGGWNGTAPFGYTYQWFRNGTAITGATSFFYNLVTADVGANITVAVTASNGGGSNTAVSVAVGPVAASAGLTLRQQIEGLEGGTITPNGRQSTNPLKVPGVDTLPTGVTRSGDIITMSGTGAQLVDWDLTGHRVTIAGTDNLVEDCYWGPTENFTALYFVQINASAVNPVVRYNTMDGFDGHGGPGTFINMPTTGSGAAATGAQGWLIEYNRYLHPNGDVLKAAGNGINQWNYYGPLTNYPVGTSTYSDATTYTAGQYALSSTPRLYRSLVDGNIGNAIPTGLFNRVVGGTAASSVNYSSSGTYALGALVNSTTDYAVYRSLVSGNRGNALTDTAAWELEPSAVVVWLSLDPHGDAITQTSSDGVGCIHRWNLFDWDSASITRAVGTTQVIRIVRNTGSSVMVGPVDFTANVLNAPFKGFYAIGTGHIRDWFSTVSYTLGGFAQVGSTYYRSLQAGNLNNPPETSPAFWEVTTDINAPGPIRYMDNWLAAGAGGLYFTSMNDAVDVWTNNRDTITDALIAGPVLRASGGADTTAPTLSGVSAADTATTATLSWSTDEATGTAYWMVDANATRTAAQIIAGGGTASGSQAVSATGAQTAIVASGLNASTAYYFHLVHQDAAGNNSTASSTAFTTEAAGGTYTQATYNTNGTARVSTTPGGTANRVEFSVWAHLSSLSSPSTPRFVRASLALEIYTSSGGVLTVTLNDSTATSVYIAASAAGVITASAKQHLYVSADWTTQTVIVRIDGTLITMTPTVGPIAGSGSLRPNRVHEVLSNGAAVTDAQFGDFWLAYSSAALLGHDTFYNGGVPPDLTGVGAPHIWLGGDLTAANLNAGGNKGSSTMTVNSGTFT